MRYLSRFSLIRSSGEWLELERTTHSTRHSLVISAVSRSSRSNNRSSSKSSSSSKSGQQHEQQQKQQPHHPHLGALGRQQLAQQERAEKARGARQQHARAAALLRQRVTLRRADAVPAAPKRPQVLIEVCVGRAECEHLLLHQMRDLLLRRYAARVEVVAAVDEGAELADGGRSEKQPLSRRRRR